MEPGLAAVDVAHLLAIEERIFLEPDTHPLTAPGRDVGRRVELDGKGRTGLQRIVTVSGTPPCASHIPIVEPAP